MLFDVLFWEEFLGVISVESVVFCLKTVVFFLNSEWSMGEMADNLSLFFNGLNSPTVGSVDTFNRLTNNFNC